MKATLGDVRATVAKVMGKCASDQVVTDTINEVEQRLLPMGKWVGTYQHYRFRSSSDCVTTPRQLETIEVAAVSRWPTKIRNEWFEYVADGFGLQGGCSSGIFDKGDGHVAFNEVIGPNKVLRVYSDQVEAADARILLQFWNQNGLPVYTEEPAASNNWINGEYVQIANSQINTVNVCMPGGLVGVQKPITKGTVYLYEYDTVTTAQRLLAIYEPDETRPSYRRYKIPFSCECVDVIAKRRFIPAIYDTDWLLIGNIGALKLGAMAIVKEEKNLLTEAAIYWEGGFIGGVRIKGARQILDDELNQFLGDGAQSVVQINDEFANAAVENFV